MSNAFIFNLVLFKRYSKRIDDVMCIFGQYTSMLIKAPSTIRKNNLHICFNGLYWIYLKYHHDMQNQSIYKKAVFSTWPCSFTARSHRVKWPFAHNCKLNLLVGNLEQVGFTISCYYCSHPALRCRNKAMLLTQGSNIVYDTYTLRDWFRVQASAPRTSLYVVDGNLNVILFNNYVTGD